MKITLATILPRRSVGTSPASTLCATYIERTSRYATIDEQRYLTESALFTAVDKLSGRTQPYLILLDSRGKQLSSEALAAEVGRLRDSGTQHLILAIGPADGWSPASRARANLLLSLGLITLPHELAAVVLAEQVYRAFAILAGHPYHSGH